MIQENAAAITASTPNNLVVVKNDLNVLETVELGTCPNTDQMAIKDALEALGGIWKLRILMSLRNGTKRFSQISKEINGISDKMLSKELKELERNHFVKRTVQNTFPPIVEYSGTEHSKTLHKVIIELRDWGLVHRKKVFGK